MSICQMAGCNKPATRTITFTREGCGHQTSRGVFCEGHDLYPGTHAKNVTPCLDCDKTTRILVLATRKLTNA